jgi:hypothetical protein
MRLPVPFSEDRGRCFANARRHLPFRSLQSREPWQSRGISASGAALSVFVFACISFIGFTLSALIPAAAQQLCPLEQVWNPLAGRCIPRPCRSNEVRGPDGQCQCRPGYVRQGLLCVGSALVVPTRPPPAPCQYGRDPDGSCRCPYGQRLRADGRTCMPIWHKCRHCCPEEAIWSARLGRCVEARRPPRKAR